MTVDELVAKKKEKLGKIGPAITAMREQQKEMEIELRRLEGRYQEIQDDLAELSDGEVAAIEEG